MSLRRLRHWLTAKATDVAVGAIPYLPRVTVDHAAGVLTRFAAQIPPLRRQVAGNMRALGVYSSGAYHDHFRALGRHFAGAMHVMRYADRRNGALIDPALVALARERIEVDESIQRLAAAAALGQGVIITGPHIAGYLLFLARLNLEIPLTVYLRYSKDARKRALKERWYRGSGVSWISEPADRGGSLGRLGSMAAALNQGRVLYITPDLPQKRHDGTPVRFFQREIYLPAGPAMLAVRTWAPFFTLVAEQRADRLRLIARGPYEPPPLGRGRDGRRVAVRQHLQWFTSRFEEFVRAQPALWYLWGDKRWRRVLAGDARYVRPLDPGESVLLGPPGAEFAGTA